MNTLTKALLKRRGSILMLLMVVIGALVFSFANNPMKLIVNGKDTGKAPVVRAGIVFVPLQVTVQGMGDTYLPGGTVDTGTVKKKDGTIIEISLFKSVATVNGKDVPLSTQTIKGATVPVSIKPTSISDILYVPSDTLQNVLKYTVEVKNNVVYVGQTAVAQTPPATSPTPTTPSTTGKLDLPYKPPAGWVPPVIMSVATADKAKNMAILDQELGFYNMGGTGAIYNPFTKADGPDPILVTSTPNEKYDAYIRFKYWTGTKSNPQNYKIPYIARELFKFYFPKDGAKIFKIVDDAYNGKNVDAYWNKMLTFENRQVKFFDVNGHFVMIVGKPEIKYDNDWNIK